MTRVVHLMLGTWTLAAMVVRTRLRVGTAYWVWRKQTAMGTGARPTGRFRAGVRYACWIGSMRTLRG